MTTFAKMSSDISYRKLFHPTRSELKFYTKLVRISSKKTKFLKSGLMRMTSLSSLAVWLMQPLITPTAHCSRAMEVLIKQ